MVAVNQLSNNLNYDKIHVKPKAIEELDPCSQFVLKTSHAS